MLRCFKNNCSKLQRNVLPLCTVILLRKERGGLYFSPDSSAQLLKRGEFQLCSKVKEIQKLRGKMHKNTNASCKKS